MWKRYDFHKAEILLLVDITVAVFMWTDPKRNTLSPVKVTGPVLQPFQHCSELAGNKPL